jgi:hypothetical protein
MADHTDVEFYRALWSRLVDDAFTAQKLVARVRRDGGYDLAGMSDRDLLDLIEGRFSGPWDGAAFAFSELLAYYSVPGQALTGEQVVGWVFASFSVAQAIDNDATDWELQFNLFLDGFLAVRRQLETDESVRIFERVFHRG